MGVTLIEMLVAIALLSVLLGGVFAFWQNLTAGRDRISTYVRREQAARVFLDRLESQLTCTMVSDARHGSGVVGRPFALRLLTRGVAVDRSPAGEASGLGDLQVVEYEFDRSANRLRARSGPADDPGPWVVVAEDLGLVRFRYHDGRGWAGSYDAAGRNRLPVAIEVAMWFHPIANDDAGAFGLGSDEDLLAGTGDERIGGTRRGLVGSGSGFGGEADAAASTDVIGSVTFDDPAVGPTSAPGLEPVPLDAYEALEPDRLLVIVVPDAPEYEYGRSFDDTVNVSPDG